MSMCTMMRFEVKSGVRIIEIFVLGFCSENVFRSYQLISCNCLFLYPVETPENQRFPDVFKEYRNRPVTKNGLG